MVKFGRQWTIKTREDYDEAMKTLDENEFIADMSDDFSCWRRETTEVADQRGQVRKQALELGLITEHEDENRHWRCME